MYNVVDALISTIITSGGKLDLINFDIQCFLCFFKLLFNDYCCSDSPLLSPPVAGWNVKANKLCHKLRSPP